MKVSLKPVASGSFTLFGDETDRTNTLELFQPEQSRQVQVEPVVRKATPAIFDRGNAAINGTLIVTKTYATRLLALASLNTVATLFTTAVHLKVEQDSTVLYYPNAVCVSNSPRLGGLSVTHQIKFVSQASTTSDPS